MSHVPTEKGSVDVATGLIGDDTGGKIPGPDTQMGPHTSQSAPSNLNKFRKLLTSKRQLVVRMRRFCETANECKSQQQFSECSETLINIQSAYNQFKRATDEVTDSELVVELVEQVADQFENCTKLHQNVKQHFLVCASKKVAKHLNCDQGVAELNPADSVSQVTDGISITSSRLAARQIKLELKRAELEANHKLALAQAQAQAAQAQAQAQAAQAQAEARRCIEEARLDAEEKLLTLSECGSVAVSRGRRSASSSQRVEGLLVTAERHLDMQTFREMRQGEIGDGSPDFNFWPVNMGSAPHPTQSVEQVQPNAKETFRESAPIPLTPSGNNVPVFPAQNDVGESTLKTYLDRQGRNEFINLASQISYDGKNIAFVFFENQIRKLMAESPYDERRLEVLRASCVGQPREMVNLFLAPMKNMSTSQRIEKALDRLRQRYGVSGGLTSEPKIMDVRYGPKVIFNVASLKAFNEDLNTLEIFAYAHDEVGKLSGQLLLDTANRLPGVLKRRYLDYLAKMGLNLNQPGFDSLRNFIVHELEVMTSDYAQTFFKSDEKEKTRELNNGRYNQVRVRQVTVKTNNETQELPHKKEPASTTKSLSSFGRPTNNKPPPACFVCNEPGVKHYIANCDRFKELSIERQRRIIIEAARCLNCLSTGHVVRNCSFRSKCRKCGPNFNIKHADVLHDYYARSSSVDLGAAETESGHDVQSPADCNGRDSVEKNEVVTRMVKPGCNAVLLRTSAVKVVNPDTGKATFAYAQHDTASQATLISKSLRDELGLSTDHDQATAIRTLAEQTISSHGTTEFQVESLSTGEAFKITNALVVPDFTDDANILPHFVNTTGLEHFNGVEIPTIPYRKSIDVLIGQSDKLLLTVLEEREGLTPDDPNFVLTRLGPIASGGRQVGSRSNLCQSRRAEVGEISDVCEVDVVTSVDQGKEQSLVRSKDLLDCCDACDCDRLKKEIVVLKENLRSHELADEVIQPSKTDDLTRDLVESNVKVINGRYEIPVPLKMDIVKRLSNNFVNACDRTVSLRRSALKNPELKRTLISTFQELTSAGWLVPVGEDSFDSRSWYLPFFVTKQDKPRVVFDGAARCNGWSINDAVLSGENMLSNLVEVLTRFRLGKFACMADLSKCFFQIAMPEHQQDLFRLVWYSDNDIDGGKIQIFRFTRHVWGINSSPFIALFAINRLITENPTDASSLTLSAIESNRYMDDLLLSSDSLADLEVVSREAMSLFESRGFKLRKWLANSVSKSILTNIPQCDLGSNIREIDLGSHPLPDCKALGLVWEAESDVLRVCCNRKLTEVSSRREMMRMLAGQFDPLGILAPGLLRGKLILQAVSSSGFDWDDELPGDIKSDWKSWIDSVEFINDISIPRYCFAGEELSECNSHARYQLHGFCDASDYAFSCVVYLRRVVGDQSSVAFIQGKSRLVLSNQQSWVISRKELEAAKLCSELMLAVSKSLDHLSCSIHLWTDSQVVLKWIVNPDLHLPRFVKRRISKIHLVASADAWNYVHTSLNPADVGTRKNSFKRSGCFELWLGGPSFLLQTGIESRPVDPSVVVRKTNITSELGFDKGKMCLDKLIDASPDLYALKKRVGYLIAFKQYFVSKVKKLTFHKVKLDATFLDKALLDIVKYVQRRYFGAAIDMLKKNSPDAFELILKQLSDKATDVEQMQRIAEMKTLRSLRPCVDTDSLLRVEGRLENADLPLDAKHPLILPSRHPLTRLIVLHEHSLAGHAGPAYTLMRTRQRFWVIYGISSAKRYIAECGKCAIRKATPIRQLMSDLPVCRVSATNKPFKFCGCDFLGPLIYRQNRSHCKAWGLLFTCLCTRAIHVELVTGLDLNNFLLAFARFTNLRGPVDTLYSDNGSTFCAAADKLPSLLDSSEFTCSVRKRNINWVRIPPYSPSQGGSWESMVKLFKSSLGRVMGEARREPSLIELQTFVSDAVRIVNDRPLTALSDKPNDLAPITPSSFLGQQLAPYTPISAFHDRGDLRRDYLYNSTLAHKFWLSWIKGYLPTLQGRSKWRVTRANLEPGQLVLIGDADDISKRGSYRLGRIHCVHPQFRKGKEIVRRATIAVLKRSGSGELEYVLRDLAKIAPL